MSDLRIAYLTDSKARMATQGYGKGRSGQLIGSGLGVNFDRWVFRQRVVYGMRIKG